MKLKLLICLCLFSYSIFSQIRFEKGYYISNVGGRVDGLIKNVDWENNPKSFEFKLTESSDIEYKSLNDVKEFGIDNYSKYVKYTVDMDRSAETIANYSYVKNPEISQETLFLKQLISGKVSLYLYRETNFHRYFYQADEDSPIQLIYKKYYINQHNIATNDHFKNQIYKNFRCMGISKNLIKNLKYQKNDLINYFKKYNQCIGSDITQIENGRQKSNFNLNVRAGVNFSSLEIFNPLIPTSKDLTFDKKSSLRFGLELEYILPFNKNKWGIIFEPNYRTYKAEGKSPRSNKISNVKYNSIELPVGVRHYFFLSEKSKIFLNASFVWDSNLDSEIIFQEKTKLEVKSQSNYAFGIGYNYDKYFVEFRYNTKRKILSDYLAWVSDFENITLTIGYNIF